MTKAEPTVEDFRQDPGYKEVYAGLQFMYPEQFMVRIGMKGLNWIIKDLLDRHYPAENFGDGALLYPSWAGEHGGDDIDPGIKWVALLRQALAVVDEK